MKSQRYWKLIWPIEDSNNIQPLTRRLNRNAYDDLLVSIRNKLSIINIILLGDPRQQINRAEWRPINSIVSPWRQADDEEDKEGN